MSHPECLELSARYLVMFTVVGVGVAVWHAAANGLWDERAGWCSPASDLAVSFKVDLG